MTIEYADYISELSELNPAGNEGGHSADDHLRLIKKVLTTTFPNFSEALTVAPSVLNGIVGTVNTKVDALFSAIYQHLVPTGSIIMWSGLVGDIPSGWSVCDGTNGTPDMRDRSPSGAGATYTAPSNYGALSHTSSNDGSHNHGSATASHTLTVNEIPSHTHNFKYSNSKVDSSGGSNRATTIKTSDGEHNVTTQSSGENGSHSHGITSDGGHTHTASSLHPVKALHFIMKTSATPDSYDASSI